MPYWRGKSILHLGVRWIMLATAVQFAFYAHPLFANPAGASVVNGAVNMQTTGNTLAITASDRSIINWQGFSIGAGETTQFIQPSANASVLNRVTSGDSSQIMGALQANGQVYLINPNGVFIGNGATINVGSFLASTANVSDESFMRGGNLTFSEASGAGIINRGTITANQGNVFLLAKTVENSGTIQAAQGTVGLMAGTQFFLKKDETGAVKVKVDSSSVLGVKAGTGVANSGVIEAMQAQLEAQGNVYALAINQSGIIRATGVSRDASGTIVLSAPGGMIRNTGTMLALNRDGSGGRLSISGQDVSLSDLSILTATGTGGSEVAVGGQIEISAVEDAIVAGRLDVTAGGSAKGGRMVVTGRRVGVFGGKLDASGGTGGGEILLGGDYQGMNPLVRNAERTYVSQDSIISADATVAGDGGKIINWSDNGTQFYGSATAKGGAVSGNGGFVEVSGRDFLDYLGSVNTLAPNGVNGALLLDPTDMAIGPATANTSGAGTAVDPFIPSASPSSLTWAGIQAALAGGNVFVTTSGSPNTTGQTGTITIGASAGWSSVNTLTFTAASGGNIVVDGLLSNATTGGLVLITSGAGQINLNANITLAGGNLTLNGSTVLTTAGAGVTLQTSNGSINLGAINSTAATQKNLTLVAGTGAITFSDAVGASTALGAIAVTSAANTLFTGGVNATSLVYTASSGTAQFEGVQTFSGALTVIANSGINYATGSSASVGGATALTSSAGSVTLNGAISTAGGSFAATGNTGVTATAGITTTLANATTGLTSGAGTVSVGGALSSSGNVTITGSTGVTTTAGITSSAGTTGLTSGAGAVSVGGAISSSGTVTISGNTGVTTTAGITSTAGNIGITATTGALSLGGAVITSVANVGAGSVTLAASSGALTILAAGDITSGGAVSLTGSTGISTAGGITTTGDNVTFVSATTLNGNVAVNTVSGGTVAFSSTLGSNNESNLTLTTDTGNINFVGAVGGAAGVNRLGDISIVSATDVSFSSTLFASAFSQTAGSGTTTFTGASNFDGNVSISAGILSLVGSMTTLNGGSVTIGSTAGNNGITGNIVADGSVSVSATGGVINLDGNITTTADLITLNSSTVLLGDQTLTSAGGNININNIINGGQILTLDAGAGNVTFASAAILGGTTGLTGLQVTGTTINLNSTTLTVDGGAGGNTITFTGATVLGANVTIDTDGVSDNNVNFAGTVNADNATTQNRTLTVTSGTGTATFGGILGASGALADLDVAAATINLNTTGITVNDQGGNTATFTGAAVLGANVTINTDGAVDNNVNFTSTINADNATTQDRTLTVTAGTGTTTFGGIVGATQALADMDVSAGTINLNANVTVDDQGGNTVNFTGATVLGGNVAIDTDGATDNNLSFAGTGTINSASSATPRNLTFNTGTGGTVSVTGAVGGTALLGTVTITQSGGATFNGAMTANTVAITDSAAGADVAFLGNLTANTAMTVAAGTAAYDVLITGTSNSIAGSSLFSNTGQLTIGDAANDVSLFTGGLTATTQSAGFGAGFLRSAGGNINLGSVTFTADSTIDATNNGAVPLGADVNLATALGGQNLTLVGGINGLVFVGGATVANLTVTADVINFSGAASITATGAVLLQGATADTTIGVGGGAGVLEIDDTDLAAIADGATSITIGQALQTGLITVSTSAFRDPIIIRSSGTLGEVQVDGLITATGATTSVTLQGATLDLNAGIDTGGGAVTLTGGIGGVDLAVAQTINTAAAADSGTDSGAVAITATGVGTINLTGNLVTTGAANSLGAGSAAGAVTITSTSGTIALANISTSGGASTLNNSNGGDAGAISINSTSGLSVTLNSSTISASGGAAGGGTGLAGDGANIDFNNPVILAVGTSTITTTGNTGGDIAFNDTVSGTFNLSLTTGNGDITFAGDAGSGVLDPLGIVSVNSVNTFISSSTFEAAQFVLAAAPLTSVTFSGGLSLSTSLTTIAGNYGFSITGASNSIAGDTNFLNQGALVLGNDALDVLTFVGGLGTTGNVTNPSSVSLAGTINTTNTQMDLGAVTLTAATTLDTGNSAVGVLNVGAVTSGGNSLTLDSGSTAGATIGLASMANLAGGLTIRDAGGLATIGGAIGNSTAGAVTVTQSTSGVIFLSTVDATTVTLTDTANGQTITFIGNLTATTGMSAAANGSYNVSILGVANTIAGATTLANTGIVRLVVGGGSNESVFTGGLTATAPSTVNIGGIVRAADAPINLGAVTLTTASTIDSAFGSPIGGLMTISSITGGGFNLALISRGQSTTVAGNATGLGTLELQDDVAFATGSMIFNGNLVANTLTTFSRAYAVQLNGAANTITTATTFNNLGALTIGQAAGSSTFTGGVVATAPSGVTLLGTVATAGTTMSLGDAGTGVTLGEATILNSGTGAINVNGALAGGGFGLTLQGGLGTGTVTIAEGISNLGSLSTTVAAYNVLIIGSNNSIGGTTVFNNTGSLTIGNAATDITLFTGGVSAPGPTAGFGAGFLRSAGGVVNLGAVTFTAASTIDTTNLGAVAAGANLTLVNALGGQNLTLTGGTAGAVDLAGATVANLTVTANGINFTGGANTITSTGAVLLQGATAATTIDVGSPAGGTGTLGISDTDLAAIASGATSLTIGQATQSGTIVVGSSAFQNPVTIQAPSGLIQLTDAVTNPGNAVTLAGPVLLATGAVSISTASTTGGNIAFNSTVDSASNLAPRSLTLTAGSGAQAGTVTFSGIVGGTAALTDLDVTAKTIQVNTSSVSVDAGPGGNTVSLIGAVTLGANVSLDLDGALGNNSVVVTGTVDSASSLVARNLTVLAGATADGILTLGDVTVTGAVGGTAPLANITVTGAGTLISGTVAADNVAFTGDLTATANEMFFNGTEVRSTGAGTITFAPTTAGRGILVTGTATGDATRLVLDTLSSIYTSGRLVIGSGTSGVVSLETLDLSGNSFSGFSFLSGDFDVTFASGSLLTLPTATDIRFQLGTGDVDGTAELNSASLSPNLVSTGGTLRFVTVDSVSLYGSVDSIQTSVSSGGSGGLVYLNEGTLNVIGSQTAAGQILIGSVNGDLNLSSQLTGTKITAYAAQNFNNTFGSTAINLQGGRGLVYSTNPDNNNPSSGNGGLTGFGATYLVPTPDVLYPTVGTYTIANAPAGSANLMAYSDPLPVSQLDTVTLNQIVQTEAYLAAVPLTGATLPALPRSDVRLGFRTGAPQQRAPAVAPLGQVDKNLGTKGQSAEIVAPGRLKVSQMKRVDETKAVGQVEGRQPMVQPVIRIGVVSLRSSGEYLPFELAEVTMGGIRISQK